MPKIDFSTIDDVNDFSPIPPGKYPCEVDQVEESTTQFGDAMWLLRFVVQGGEYVGRYIFDNLVFSEAAKPRVKLFCSRIGLDVSGEIDLKPAMIEGHACAVSVEIEEYEDREGNTKKRNKVPFAGYDYPDTLGADSATSNSSEEQVPF